LDFTTVVSGPLCTQVLGDLGADVVKVEAPRGDSARRMGPPFRAGLGPVWVQFNRNKRAIVIQLQQPDGVAVARRIAAGATSWSRTSARRRGSPRHRIRRALGRQPAPRLRRDQRLRARRSRTRSSPPTTR
jgi:hypothetical protein